MSFTAKTVIDQAYAILAQFGADKQVVTGDDNDAYALGLLNALSTMMENYGGFLWKRSIAYLFSEQGTVEYTLDGTTSSYITNSYSATTLTAELTSTSTLASVTSTSSMLVADKLIFDIGNGAYFKTTVSSITNSTTVVPAAFPASGVTIPSGALVFNFPTILSVPVRVYRSGKRRYSTSSVFTDNEHDHIYSFDDFYFTFANKTQQTSCSGIAYLNQGATGQLKIFGTRTTSPVEVVMFSNQQPITQASTSASTMDFPDRWKLYMSYMLAALMAPSSQVTQTAFQQIIELATKWEVLALHGDTETASFIPLVNNFRNK